MRTAPLTIASAVALITLAGCGAKTGLLIPDADEPMDADVEVDAEPDADICVPRPVAVDPRRAQVIFVVDRSESMRWNLEGDYPRPGEATRWVLMGEALERALTPREHLIEIGGKFYPTEETWIDPDAVCRVDPGIELPPAPNYTTGLISFFATTSPNGGGTPTALALEEARAWFAGHAHPSVARFVVLATDGGPNCMDAPPVPWSSCVCTGPISYCPDPDSGYRNCLDTVRTLDVIDATFADGGIPVFVIGIDDPGRPDLADFLDEMAIAGGRPRPEPADRRFYSVRREGELEVALESITDVIARCLFVATSADARDPAFELAVDGVVVPRDPERLDGWDWTDAEASELTLFGAACERASVDGASVTGEVPCDEI